MFELTAELKAQIETHNEWMCTSRQNERPAEPFNPWTQIVEQMQDAVKDIKLNWGDSSELVTFFIEKDYTGDYFDHLMERYSIGAIAADDIIQALKPFKPLQDLNGH